MGEQASVLTLYTGYEVQDETLSKSVGYNSIISQVSALSSSKFDHGMVHFFLRGNDPSFQVTPVEVPGAL